MRKKGGGRAPGSGSCRVGVPLPPAQSAGGTMLRKAGGYAQVSGDGQSPTGAMPRHVLAFQ